MAGDCCASYCTTVGHLNGNEAATKHVPVVQAGEASHARHAYDELAGDKAVLWP
jgi:hypothetical protein